MNREETIAIMSVLRAAYPSFYKDKGRAELEGIVSLWAEMFRDDPAQLVAAAVKTHIATDAKGFPPNIGQIKAALVRITKPPELEMSELEAWALVRKAIHGASMEGWSRKWINGKQDPRPSAVRNFEALPELLQRLVGSPEQLASWEKLDDDEINTITQSNFLRSFRARAASEKERLAMPADIRALMDNAGSVMALNSGNTGGRLELEKPTERS